MPSFHRATLLLRLGVLMALAMWLAPSGASAEAKRKPQDYGAPKSETTVGEVALWVPRVVLFPLWLTSEYLVRKPIGALVQVAEREQWPEELFGLFVFGNRRQISVYPSALFDFGLLPSVGFNAQWNYFLADPNTLRLHFGTWGPDWIATRLVDRYAVGHDETVTLDTSFVRRKDNPFFGMGPRSGSDRLRFLSTVAEAGLGYENRFWRSSSFGSRAGMRALDFGSGACCGEPSIADAVAAGTLPPPPGFGRGYTAIFEGLSLAIDSRKPRPDEGGGFRIELHGEGVFAPGRESNAGGRSWVRYGGSVGAAIDLVGSQRIVALNLAAELADPMLGTIPFTDQVSLGGDSSMRGFIRDRLIDRSALVARLQYTWPVWVFLDGVIETDVGNVFGAHFAGFEPGLLRMSSGIGVRSNGERDSGLELLIAAGTDPFEGGFHVSSFRFVFGSHHGF